MTQKRLAELTGLATGTIQQYELEKRQPRLEQLQKIADMLDIDISELLTYKEKTYQIIGIHDETETYHIYPAATIEEFKKRDKNLKGNNIEELSEQYQEDTEGNYEEYLYLSITNEDFQWLEETLRQVIQQFHRRANIKSEYCIVEKMYTIKI